MKKTEKIEVRVSAEEKDRLTKMAEKRGQSISDMIRTRMSGDEEVSAKNTKRNQILMLLPLYLGVFLLCLAILSGSKGTQTDELPYMTTIGISARGYDDFDSIYNVPHLDGYSRKYEVLRFSSDGEVEATFDVTLNVEKRKDGEFLLKTNACKKTGTGCEQAQEFENIMPSPAPTQGSKRFYYFGELDDAGGRDVLFFKITGPQSERQVPDADQ